MYQNIFISSTTEDQPATVYVWDDEKGLITAPYSDFDYAYRRDPTGAYTSIYGHKLKKVHFWNRDAEEVFESDVPRETRVLTDLYLDSDELPKGHKVGNIDIEVSSEGGFASIEKADKKILSITMGFGEPVDYITFVLDEDHRLTDQNYMESHVLRFDTEEQLLEAFMNWYSEQGFTIITGWNVSGFDIPYLYRRIRYVLDEHTANMLSPIGMIKWSQRRERYQLAGVSILDYLEMYKKFTFTARPNYRLDTIGLLEVSMSKIDLGMTIDDIYEENIFKFLEYNIHDVKIVTALDKKLRLIELVKGICHAGHVQYEDYTFSSKFIEGTILVYLHRKGIICPNKPIDGQEQMAKRDEEGDEGFAGAYVKEPVPGLYEWVYSLDLQSLYPSIIMSLNISPETKVGRVYDWDVEKHMKKTIETYKFQVQSEEFELNRDDFISFMEKMQFSLSSNGIIYMTEKQGVIPEILDKWFNERIEYRKLYKKHAEEGNTELASYYDKRQHVQKIFLNSIYGVLGLPIFRFYDIDNALAVTATGQDVIKTSARFLNNKYQKTTGEDTDYCIYIDTDSVYFSAIPMFAQWASYQEQQSDLSCQMMNPSDSDRIRWTINTALASETVLNKVYDTMSRSMFFCKNHRFKIRGEAVARRGFWVAKKRYALWQIHDLETDMDVDKIKIKGLDVVRSSFPPAFSKFMSKTLDDILKGKDKAFIDESVHNFHSNLSKVKYVDIARNTSVKDMTKYDDDTTSIITFKKGTPAHVKAALAYNRYLTKKKWHKKHGLIRNGDKIKYVYLRSNPLGLEAIAFKGFDDPKEIIQLIEEYIDYEKLFNNELKGKLEDFYSALSWGNLPTEMNQLAESFFGF